MNKSHVTQTIKQYWLGIEQFPGVKLLLKAIQRFTLLEHKTGAAALTYTTLFALVPLLTVTYSVLSMIPSLQESRGDIEQLLMGNLVPASGDTLKGYLYQFSQQAQKLTAVGIVFLMITAFMMLRSIENTFNKVWQLKKGRKGVSSFLLYWAILSLGPLILSAGLAVSSYISSLGLWKEDWVPTSGTVALAIIIPYLSSFFAFTLIYWAVPNCAVPLKHAAIGGGVVALLFEIGQEIFASATTFFPSYQLIYGAFAAVPLFLLWLYISWSVILLGAEIVYLQGKGARSESDCSENKKKEVGLELLSVFQGCSKQGVGVSLLELQSKFELNTEKALSESLLNTALDHLIDLNIIILKTDQYYLVRDLFNYSLNDYLSDVPAGQWLEMFSQSEQYEIVNHKELSHLMADQHKKLSQDWSMSVQEFLLKDKI